MSKVLYAFLVWMVVMAVTQGRPLIALAVTLAAVIAVIAHHAIRKHLRFRSAWGLWIMTPAAIAVWIDLAGSYSIARDVVVCLGACLLSALVLWRGGAMKNLFSSTTKTSSTKTVLAFQLLWLALSWVSISITDRMLESKSVGAPHVAVSPVIVPELWKPLRIGLALSGGGYRAALVHAGVLEELRAMGVPVHAISSVSGGSILGGFIASGGSPEVFVIAVEAGRFRLLRDLTWPWNLLRLPAPMRVRALGLDLWPAGRHTQLDVQADLLDRVLFGGRMAADVPSSGGPRIIVNATDLHYGLSVGFMRDGLLLYGPLADALVAQSLTFMPDVHFRPGYFKLGDSLKAEPLGHLSDRVAASGAFPGAFPTRDLEVPVVTGGMLSSLRLQLADGGIRDNLGVNSLLLADRLARQKSGNPASSLVRYDSLSPDWRLDLIIASDGGQVLGVPDQTVGLGAVLRAIELNGMQTGSMRPLPSGTDPSVVLLWENQVRAFVPDDVLIGGRPDNRKTHPEDILKSFTNDTTLVTMGRMHPEHDRLEPLLTRFAAAAGTGDHSGYCNDDASTPLGCARLAVEREVGADIWHTFEVFSQTETLRDTFRQDEATDIVRYGRYLVRLNETHIREEITSALARRARNAP